MRNFLSLQRICFALVLYGSTVGFGYSQAPVPPDVTFSSELIEVKGFLSSFPLRHGHVIPESETVTLNGTPLAPTRDYTIDNETGVLYIMQALRSGDSIQVQYRFDPKQQTTGSSVIKQGSNAFQLSLLPGAGKLNFGLAVASRGTDGSTMLSNILGWDNSLKFGSAGNLQSAFYFGDQQAASNFSNFGQSGAMANADAGKSQLILENYSQKLLGGAFNAGYQNISSNFAGIGMLSGQTYSQPTLDALFKEKGMKRFGLGFSGVHVGETVISTNFNSVSLDGAGIQKFDYAIAQKGFKASFGRVNVDKGFTRFSDLQDADRDLLARFQGTDRTNLSLGYDWGKQTLGFSSLNIGDSTKGHITQSVLDYKGANFSANFGTQQVQKEFTQFANLQDSEKPIFSLDAGLRRDWYLLNGNLTHGASPFMLAQKTIRSDTGNLSSSSQSITLNKWTLSHADVSADKGFASFGSINPTDTDQQIQAIGALYGPGVAVNAPAERGLFAASAGISRQGFGLAGPLGKTGTFSFNQLRLTDNSDSGSLSALHFAEGALKLDYERSALGAKFAQAGNLMAFEKGQLGSAAGISSAKFSLSDNIGKTGSFSFSQSGATAADGGMDKRQLILNTPKLQITANLRSVDAGFSEIGNVADPEIGLLNSIKGYSQSDAKLHWDLSKSLKFDFNENAKNSIATNDELALIQYALGYDKNGTTFSWVRNVQSANNIAIPFKTSENDLMTFRQQLGKNTSIHFSNESQSFDVGSNPSSSVTAPTGLAATNYQRQTVGIDVKVSPTTTLSTERIQTQYASGQSESQQTNAITTQLSKRAGVTVSDTELTSSSSLIDDQAHRDYGFWYQIGKDLMLRYGYVRQLDTNGAGTLTDSVTLGKVQGDGNPANVGAIPQANVGDVAVGGGYGVNQSQLAADPLTRTQSFSNIRLNSIKGVNIGLFKDIKFAVDHDTAADNFNWIRENQEFQLSTNVLGNQIGFDYHGQMDPTGNRAVDRSFQFSTDPKNAHLLSGSIAYKIRTLPQDQNFAIRNFALTFRPNKTWSLTNEVVTNPEIVNTGVLLGSVPQASRMNKLHLDFAGNKTTDLGFSWQEEVNQATHAVNNVTGMNWTLFKNTSPLKLFYGLESVGGNVAHSLTQRWSVQYDQKAGPRQNFSFFVSNLAYAYATPTNQFPTNWTVRLDYELHF